MRRALLALLLCCGCYDGKLEQGLTLTCSTPRYCPADHECEWGRCVSAVPVLTDPVVTPAHLKVGARLVASFSAPDLTRAPTVVLAGPQGETLAELQPAGAGPDHVFEWVATAGVMQGPAIVLADVTTPAGVSLGHRVGAVTLDFTSPTVTAVVLPLAPGADNPLLVPRDLGVGATLSVLASADEALAGGGTGALVPCDGGPPTLALAEKVESDRLHVFSATLADAGVPQGCHVVRLELADLAGNVTVVDGGTVEVDTAAPPPPDTREGHLVYRREPHGDGQGRRTPSFSLRVNDGGITPDSFLVVTLAASLAPITAPVRLPRESADPIRLEQLTEDNRVVFVAAADHAGNTSARVPVQDIEWLGVGGRSPELALVPRPADTPALRQAKEQRAIVPDGGSIVWPRASWRRVSTDRQLSTGPRLEHAALACDEERRTCMLFGGQREGGFVSSETWRWDGEGWHALDVAGPPARVSAAMAFDPVRRVYVLVGGRDAVNVTLADVWELFGETTWIERRLPFPGGALERHAMTYDLARQRVQLFTDGTLYELASESGQWTSVTYGPEPRHDHALLYDRRARRTLIIGGEGGNPSMLVFDAANEQQPFTRLFAPPAAQHAAAYDAVTGQVVVGRGVRPATRDACFTWPSADGGWAPGPDCSNQTLGWDAGESWAIAFAQAEGLVLHGNPADRGVPTTFLFPRDGGAPVPLALAGPSPSSRWRHTMTSLAVNRVLLAGGNAGRDDVLADAKLFSPLGWVNTGNLPLPVERHATVRLPGGGALTVGGLADAGFSREFSAGAWGATAAAPLERQGHSAAVRGDGRVVVFGGGTALGDGGMVYEPNTWVLGPAGNWAQPPLSPQPPPRRSGAMVSLPDGGVLLFGGLGELPGSPPADTWLYTSAGWQVIDAGTRPPPRGGPAMATDRDGKVVLFGGRLELGSAIADTWELADGRWARLEIEDPQGDEAPTSRQDAAMALGPRGDLVLFGGGVVDRELYNDTWELRRHEAAQLVSIAFDRVANVGATLRSIDVRVDAFAPDAGAPGVTASLWSDLELHVCGQHDAPAPATLSCTVGAGEEARLRRLSLSTDLGVVVRPKAKYPDAAGVFVGPTTVELHYRLEGAPR